MAEQQTKTHQKRRKRSDDNNTANMTDVQLSKALSWVLRHSGPSLGLKLAPDGFVPLEDVLSLHHPRFMHKKGGHPKYTVEDVRRVVENNDKQRFRLEHKNGVLCIRANQGHSVRGLQSDELLTPLTAEELSDPNLLIIHGTTRKAWEDHIQHEGLSRMKRNHIHFATGLPKLSKQAKPSSSSLGTKRKQHEHQTNGNGTNSPTPISGMRSSSEIYIYIDGPRCAKDGVPFHRSDNGVILTSGVDEKKGMLPTKYFEKAVCALSGKVIWTPPDGDEDERH